MRFAIIDDHPFVLDALSIIISSMEERPSVSGFGSLEKFEQAVGKGDTFDLVLLDLGIPGFTGLGSLRRFRALESLMPVVVISASDDRATILEALDLGAMGFIPKTSGRDVLMRALELVLAGGIYIPPQALERQEESLTKQPARVQEPAAQTYSRGPAFSSLTQRQCDVLELLVKGLPNKLICRELDLSPNTVKSHISAIFRALNATNRTQAVIAAQSGGFRVGYEKSASGTSGQGPARS
jgi:DNA-binding NarL/FixJ family response regulator